jgi:hypothetical protein
MAAKQTGSPTQSQIKESVCHFTGIPNVDSGNSPCGSQLAWMTSTSSSARANLASVFLKQGRVDDAKRELLEQVKGQSDTPERSADAVGQFRDQRPKGCCDVRVYAGTAGKT